MIGVINLASIITLERKQGPGISIPIMQLPSPPRGQEPDDGL